MNPYKELDLDKTATADQIKKAYREKAKSDHPDKGGDKDKFAVLAKSYAILSNPESKSIYDETGSTEEQGIDKITEIAKQKIMGEFDRYIDSRKQTIFTDNIPDIIGAALHEGISLIDDDLKKDSRQLEYLTKLKGRMECEGTNLFELVLDSKIKQVEIVNRRTLKERKVIERCMELMEDFKYNFDKNPESMWGPNNATSQQINQHVFTGMFG